VRKNNTSKATNELIENAQEFRWPIIKRITSPHFLKNS
jgi:hypothetical protein